VRILQEVNSLQAVAEMRQKGIENPRVGGSIPSPGTSSKPSSIKGLQSTNSFRSQPENPSKHPSSVPSCARENLGATNSSQDRAEFLKVHSAISQNLHRL